MNTKSIQTEEMFLKLFKFVILAVMTLTLVVAAGALIFAAYQYTQSPKAPLPAQKALDQSVNIDEFLKQLEKNPQKQEESVPEEPKAEPPAKSEPVKYREEANNIYGCIRESNKIANISLAIADEDVIENFRKQFQRVADFKNAERGQPYVMDAVKVVCEIYKHPKVTTYRKSNQQIDFFADVVNFHLKHWDKLKLEAKKFEEAEISRVNREERDEELRVAASKQAAIFTLLVAAGAFAVFMALGLYLIISAMESNLRRISLNLEKISKDKVITQD